MFLKSPATGPDIIPTWLGAESSLPLKGSTEVGRALRLRSWLGPCAHIAYR